MTLGLYEKRARRRRRRRVWSSIAKLLIVLGVGAACIVYAYQTGLSVGEREVAALKNEIGRLSQTVADLRNENAALRGSAEAAQRQAAALRERYSQDVPAGEIKELLELARNKLAAGIEPNRLARVIEQTGSPETCEDAPTTKRFIVHTPLYQGGNDAVSFADDTITISAQGASAIDADGNPEAWFDPEQPIMVHFTHDSEEKSVITGTLPLRHSVVTGNWEYRFTIAAGDRAFLRVASLRCRYP